MPYETTNDIIADRDRLRALNEEMLEALKELVTQNESYGYIERKDINNALKVIAKVEGR